MIGHVLHELLVVKEIKQRRHLARFLVYNDQRKNTAVRMAIARRPAPRSIGPLQHIHHARKCRITRQREPITQRFKHAVELILKIMRHSGQRITLGDAVLVGHILVTAGEADRLERDRLDLVDILCGKFDDAADTARCSSN